MKCKDVYRYICENLDADMKSARCRAIKQHLNSCTDCEAYLDSLKKTILLYKNESEPTIPTRTKQRLHKIIDITIFESSSKKPKGRSLNG